MNLLILSLSELLSLIPRLSALSCHCQLPVADATFNATKKIMQLSNFTPGLIQCQNATCNVSDIMISSFFKEFDLRPSCLHDLHRTFFYCQIGFRVCVFCEINLGRSIFWDVYVSTFTVLCRLQSKAVLGYLQRSPFSHLCVK